MFAPPRKISTMTAPRLEYVASGGNRNPSAADWNCDILAYGTGSNIALWDPQSTEKDGVSTLVSGHTDVVNAVKVFHDPNLNRPLLISGSADKTVRIWRGEAKSPDAFVEAVCLKEHTGSVNAVAVLPESGIFITGAADATVKIWQYKTSGLEVCDCLEIAREQ